MVIEKITALTKGFTLSPKPLNNVKYDRWVLFIWWRRIHEVISPFSTEYDIYPEFDDSGRLHFHGVFSCKDKVKFYKTQNRLKKHGFVKYEGHVTDKWLDYCKKDLLTTREVFDDTCCIHIPMLKENYCKMRDELRIDFLDAQKKSRYLCFIDGLLETEPSNQSEA